MKGTHLASVNTHAIHRRTRYAIFTAHFLYSKSGENKLKVTALEDRLRTKWRSGINVHITLGDLRRNTCDEL